MEILNIRMVEDLKRDNFELMKENRMLKERVDKLSDENEMLRSSLDNTLYIDAVRYENDFIPRVVGPLFKMLWKMQDELEKWKHDYETLRLQWIELCEAHPDRNAKGY